MNKRLNITLPEQTVRLMDRVAGKGQRSSLIDRASALRQGGDSSEPAETARGKL